ncbi:MAG: flagellar basal-body rod protein FlgF [Methylocystis sp.]|nr:flagellar basal-body rod protein FlgF [Methylocystis sp.]
MQSAFYVSLSTQMSVDKRMETIANNIANAGTVGYRAGGVSFAAALSKAGSTSVAYASSGRDFISRAAGDTTRTDNPYDVAVVGNAWLGIQTASGPAYTRDGRMQMLETGELQTVSGSPILDAGNSPLVLDPNAGPPMISRDGMINQGGRQVGAVGLFAIDDGASLTRGENSSVIPSIPATPVLDFQKNGVVQGSVEGSNVNPVHEMTKLILASRSFDSVSSLYDMLDSSQRSAIRTLGGAT